jgi:hypothetical protein
MIKSLIATALLASLAVPVHAGDIRIKAQHEADKFIQTHSRDDCVHVIKYGSANQPNPVGPDLTGKSQRYQKYFYMEIWNWLIKTGPPMLPGQDHPD